MSVVGHGIDLVDVARIEALLKRHGRRFLDRCFSDEEVAYSRRRSRRMAEHLAVRFAAKEAVMKVLGTGRRQGIAWREIEVMRLPTGQPVVKLSGSAAEFAERLGITTWHISLSHTPTTAAASAIGLK